MALSKEQINRLIEAVKKHVNWLVYVLGGGAALSADEIKKLQADKTLPADLDVALVENSYVLGRTRMLLKKREYADLTFAQLLELADGERTPVEELAIEHSLLSAGLHLKQLSQDIADGAYDAIMAAGTKTLNEAGVKDIIRDEVAFGIIRRKNYQVVASDLAHSLKTDWRRDWRRVAETELHRAKVQGQVQAMLNKVDVYKFAEGPDSRVSIMPAPDRCVDCHHHYLDQKGNPKIFALSELLGAGSNGDEGVSHKRQNGRHVHWKTTLPPLHPRCGCNLVYVPPGYSWVDGMLSLTDKEAYKASIVQKSFLSKGNGTAAETNSGKTYSPFKPAATPMGAASNEAKAPAPPSSPGIDSPGRATGGNPMAGMTSASAGSSTKTTADASPAGAPQSGTDGVVDCPLGVQRCTSLGGSGKHHSDSSTYTEHQQMAMQGMAALSAGGDATQNAADGSTTLAAGHADPGPNAQGERIFVTAEELPGTLQTASTWKHNDNPTAKTLEHLSVGKVAIERKLNGGSLNAGEDGAGVYKLTIHGNGSGCFKPERARGTEVNPLKMANAEGMGIVAENTSHKREVAAYKHSASYSSQHVPVTTYRNHEGREGSVQAWLEGHTTLSEARNGMSDEQLANYSWMDDDSKSKANKDQLLSSFNAVKFVVDTAPNPEQAKEQLSRAVIQDLMINNCDGHLGNFQFKHEDDRTNLHGIDKGLAFGRGFQNSRNMIGGQMKKNGYQVKIPSDMESQMRNRSFADEMRAVGSDVSPQEAAETFLRTKYLLHLQDTEGQIDHNHFMHTPNGMPDPYEMNMLGHTNVQREYFKGTADQRFQKWSDNYLTDMKNNPEHPHHAEYKSVDKALRTIDRDESPVSRARKKEQATKQQGLKDEFDRLQAQHAPNGDKTGPATPVDNKTAPSTPVNLEVDPNKTVKPTRKR